MLVLQEKNRHWCSCQSIFFQGGKRREKNIYMQLYSDFFLLNSMTDCRDTLVSLDCNYLKK